MTVLAGATFAAGLRTEFLQTYEQAYKGLDRLDTCMKRDVPSDKFMEKYVYYETSPYLRLWRRGTTMSMDQFKAIQYQVVNLEWAMSIPWHYRDRNDDQTKSLVTHARQTGTTAALLDERVFFQIVKGSVDADLLPSDFLPTAPDGAALYATTAGGAARFGATNGNLISGTGVSVPSTIVTDLFTVMAQFGAFQDTKGQPLLPESVIDGGLTLLIPNALRLVFNQALRMAFQPYTTVTAGNVTVSNVFKDMAQKINPIFTQRLTTNSWYAFLNDAPVKPIFSQLREPIQDVVSTFENSDVARHTGIESIRWFESKGYGVNLPVGTIKVYNA